MTPRKLAGLVLAVVGPCGVGHFHVGRRARGAAWLTGATAGLVVAGAAIPALGPRAGWAAALALPLALLVALWTLSVVDLARAREGDPTPIWQTAIFAVVGLAAPAAASAFLRAFVLESYVVPTRSMEPALLAGDHLIADKRARAPTYGDVIVFDSPEHPGQTLVKRVVARPGDVLETRRGRPFVNGWQVPYCVLGTARLGDATGELDVEFLGEASYLVFYDGRAAVAEHAGPLYAAADAVLVLGDDRNDSADSRAWHQGRDGNVHASALRGRALAVWLRTSPLDCASFGIDLARLELPSSLDSLRPALERCLRARPPSTPPPPMR